MKPRKQKETDAEYISRLEMANDQLRKNDKEQAQRAWAIYHHVRDAAAWMGMVVNAAAEACDMSDHESVKHVRNVVDVICGLPWGDHAWPSLPPVPKLDHPTYPIKGGDAEMIAKSVVADLGPLLKEIREQRGHKTPDNCPDDLSAKDALIRLSQELSNALMDLEFSLEFLRMDLRAGMYAYFVSRVQEISRDAFKMYEPSEQDHPF